MSRMKTTKYDVGSRVKVKPGKEHDKMTMGKTGTVVEIGTPALGIKFEGMSETHRWYTDAEVESVPMGKK